MTLVYDYKIKLIFTNFSITIKINKKFILNEKLFKILTNVTKYHDLFYNRPW